MAEYWVYTRCEDLEPTRPPITPPPDPTGEGGLPPGGTDGQVLTRASSAPGGAIWADGGGGGGGTLLQPLKASVTVGGVTAGRTFPVGTSYDEIFRAILSPSLNPTLAAPSATLAINGDKLLEKGATTTRTATITFNRGKIDPAYATSGYRSGPATGYTLNGSAVQASSQVQISESNRSFSGSVAYSAGEQPKNSAGGNYDSPLPAGSVSTNTITFEFVEALYGTTVNLTTMTKQPLVSKSAGRYVFHMAAQTFDDFDMFDVPASWQITNFETWNPVTNKWDDVSHEFPTATDVTHQDAGGNTVAYKRYTDNRGYSAMERDIRIKWRA